MAVVKAHLTLRLDLETNAKIKTIAKNEHRSTSNMIDFIIKTQIQQYEAEHGIIQLSDDSLYLE